MIYRAASCEDLSRRHPLSQVGPQRHVRDLGGRRSAAQHGLARLGAVDGQRGDAKLIAEVLPRLHDVPRHIVVPVDEL
eukprot:9489377-Pyramimonas_sp.AAC.1